MNLTYEQVIPTGKLVSVATWITFENQPVMRVSDFHKLSKLSWTKKYLLRMTIEDTDTNGVANADHPTITTHDLWLTLSECQRVIDNFERLGGEFIFTYEFIIP